MTYHDLCMNVKREMEKAGCQAARLESMELISLASGKTAEELVRDMRLTITEDVIEKTAALMVRWRAGEPIAYLSGEWAFYRLPFYVSPGALIPRIDTEMLVPLAVEHLSDCTGHTRVLDLCSGTGCLGISVAYEKKDAWSVLVDLSDEALELCKRNIRRHNLTGRVISIKADVRQEPSPALGQFDIVLCNPPYIPTGDIAKLDQSVRDYEPILALDGGKDGLDFYRTITSQWKSVIRPGGHLLYEVGIGQAEAVAWFMVKAGYENIRIIRDSAGIERVVEGKRPADDSLPEARKEGEE